MTQYKQTEGKKKDIPNFRILGCQLEAFLYLDEEMTDTENPSRRIPERKREPEIQDEFKTFQAKLLRSKLVPILEQPGLFPDIDDCSMPSASKFNLPQHGFIFKVDFSFAAARLLAALSAQSCRWASAVNSWGCSASSASYGAFRSGCELQVDPSQALCRVCPKDRFGGPLGRFFAVFESGGHDRIQPIHGWQPFPPSSPADLLAIDAAHADRPESTAGPGVEHRPAAGVHPRRRLSPGQFPGAIRNRLKTGPG
eukprot:CAMPEP_0172151838 /NCGR_PEP_ID=MMETSP1050-20130122/472_1 /TAXON_ID=233186 /ORGANISM="Cryptomonas curvata, Strain CCAP979/52" /LENGTH=253 /DNA_ID=CAMNT_0012820029 /DNA_START=226 /DNA_END=982 /DNA_ORIENTATION=+